MQSADFSLSTTSSATNQCNTSFPLPPPIFHVQSPFTSFRFTNPSLLLSTTTRWLLLHLKHVASSPPTLSPLCTLLLSLTLFSLSDQTAGESSVCHGEEGGRCGERGENDRVAGVRGGGKGQRRSVGKRPTGVRGMEKGRIRAESCPV